MKRVTTILLGLLAVAATGVLLREIFRKRRRAVRQTVADEGYETAIDILYPSRRRGAGEHYGPVLP